MTNKKLKYFTPVIGLFLTVNVLFIILRQRFQNLKIDQDVIIVGNLLLFVITVISFALAQKGLRHKNPNVFFRGVYSSIMIKLFTCILASFIYIALYRNHLNKPALFICMGLYLLYTFIEVSVLTKMLKLRDNE
ncbi:MAG: hypothetical protein NVS9B7_00170 [Flavisolibacter sp.]